MPLAFVRSMLDTIVRRQAELDDEREVRAQTQAFRILARARELSIDQPLPSEIAPLGATFERLRLQQPSLRPAAFTETLRDEQRSSILDRQRDAFRGVAPEGFNPPPQPQQGTAARLGGTDFSVPMTGGIDIARPEGGQVPGGLSKIRDFLGNIATTPGATGTGGSIGLGGQANPATQIRAPSLQQGITPSVSEESAQGFLRNLGVPGPLAEAIGTEAAFLTSPFGAAGALGAPQLVPAATLGGIGLGAGGEALEDAGVPGPIGEIGQIAGNILAPGAGLVRFPRRVRTPHRGPPIDATGRVIEADEIIQNGERFVPYGDPEILVPRTTVDPVVPVEPRLALPPGEAATAAKTTEPYATPLRDFGTVVAEAVPTDHIIPRTIAARTGVNPGTIQTDPVGLAITAYQRQRVAAEQLAEVAVSLAFDSHVQRFTGARSVFKIQTSGPNKGEITNVKIRGVGERDILAGGKTSLQWNDVLSNPNRYIFTEEQLDMALDFYRLIDEVEALRVAHGLEPRASRGPEAVSEGWFYVPRQVKGIEGVELQRPSSANHTRHFDEAEEGHAAGVDYLVDMREVGRLHTRQAYIEMANKDLADHIAELQVAALRNNERIYVIPKELVPEPVRIAYADAVSAQRAAASAITKERLLVINSRARAAQDITRLRGLKAREQEALAGLRGRAGSRARQQPLSLGQEIKTHEARIATLDEQITELRSLSGDIPRIRRGAGVTQAVSPKTQARFDATRREAERARAAYSRAVDDARAAGVAPAELFGHAEGVIPIKQWRGRFFPDDQAERLERGIDTFFTTGGNAATEAFEKTGNMVRFLSAVGDFAEPFIQGLPTIAYRPGIWARSALLHYQAFFDPTVQARLIKEYAPEFQEMARNGTPVGDPEFFAALEPGRGFSPGALLKVLPKGDEARALLQQGGRQIFGRFQASYGTGLGGNRAMLTRSLQEVILDEAERQAFIRNMTGGLDSRALGVGPGQRGVESMFLGFSPRLIRATAALVFDLRRGIYDPRGRQAWIALTRLAAAATGVYVVSGLALGKGWDEIKEGLNPLNGKKFLSHEISGQWIGIGGQVRAIVQLLATSAVAGLEDFGVDTGVEDPGTFKSFNIFENPVLEYYNNRGAVGTNLAGGAVEAVTGANALPFDDIDNVPDFIRHVGKSSLPFTLQGVLEGERGFAIPAALIGLRTSPQTEREEEQAALRSFFDSGRFDPSRDQPPQSVFELSNEEEVAFFERFPELKVRAEKKEEERRANVPGEASAGEISEEGQNLKSASLDQAIQDVQTGSFPTIAAFWDDVNSAREKYVGVVQTVQSLFAERFAELDERFDPTSDLERDKETYRAVNDRHPRRINDEQWEAYEQDLARSLTPQQIAAVETDLTVNQHPLEQQRRFLLDIVADSGYWDAEEPNLRNKRLTLRRANAELDASRYILGRTTTVLTARAQDQVVAWAQQIWGIELPKPPISSRNGAGVGSVPSR